MSDTRHPVHIDTRTVLRGYAAITLTLGVVLVLFAPLWFTADLGGVPWLRAALIRILGSMVVAAGCFGIALARIEEPESRRQGLLWLAIGHGVVAVVVTSQQFAVFDTPLAAAAAALAWAAAFLLFYGWQFGEDADGRFGTMVSLFGGSAASSTRRLRSEYERGIRQAAAQEERHRLARDLHDSIKQQLFAIHTGAATAQARFDVEPAGARAAIDQIRASAREAMGEMEAMLHGLRAAPLENVGLVEALKQSCEALAFRTGASVEFIPADLPPSESLPPGAQDAIFRVAQEALANVARHARAGHVRVTLAGSDGELELTIKDDGAGFDQAQPARGLGLANMRARAAECGGHMEVISQPGSGTRVRMTTPSDAPDPADAKFYGRRAFFSGMMAFMFFMLSVVRPPDDMLILYVPMLILMLVSFVRELVAYRRTRRPSEARR